MIRRSNLYTPKVAILTVTNDQGAIVLAVCQLYSFKQLSALFFVRKIFQFPKFETWGTTINSVSITIKLTAFPTGRYSDITGSMFTC